jgi:hypothetical protein
MIFFESRNEAVFEIALQAVFIADGDYHPPIGFSTSYNKYRLLLLPAKLK